tara:strand:- start:369 stop:614 length:246 start_codon:yes stop_codon:yes gene_type:complete
MEPKTFSEILNEPIDKERIFESESAYRRGYLHGYDSAIDDIAETSVEKVIKFFDRKLTQWRYGKRPYKDCNEFELPPQNRF